MWLYPSDSVNVIRPGRPGHVKVDSVSLGCRDLEMKINVDQSVLPSCPLLRLMFHCRPLCVFKRTNATCIECDHTLCVFMLGLREIQECTKLVLNYGSQDVEKHNYMN
jgi:hypothetical protein